MLDISVIVPVYNEGNSVKRTNEAILSLFSARLSEMTFEIVYVDDGSSDDSFLHLCDLSSACAYVRAIRLLCNCGSHMAIRAGLEHARGRIVCFLAADLQDPPEIIPDMINALTGGVEVVWAVRNDREDSFFSRFAAKIFYGLARSLACKNMPPGGASMFLIGPRALQVVRQYKERNLTLEGLFATIGLPNAYVYYDRKSRQAGYSKWTLEKKLKLFIDFFVAYSYAPIRIISYLGLVVASLGFIYSLIVLFNRIFLSDPIQGWTSLMLAVLILSGIQMMMLGIMGEYIWRTIDEVRARPRYIVETIIDCHESRNHRVDNTNLESK